MLSFRLAVRFLRSGRAQTVLIIAGIAIAISIQVFVGLLIGSLQQSLVDSVVGSSPQVTIVSSGDIATIRGWQDIVAAIEKEQLVKDIALTASGNAFVGNGNSTVPVLLRGVEIEFSDRIYGITEAIYQGTQIRSQRDILIGRELAGELELVPGEQLDVFFPEGGSSSFTVNGIYDLGASGINESWIFVNLATAQKVFDYGDRLTAIEMTVDDVFQADVVAADIQRVLDNDTVTVENWKDQNQDLLEALESQQLSSTIIQAVIIVSVVIAIASVLAISVLQKSRQLGILKAMGIKDVAASLIFVYQGFLIGLVGSIIGTLLGLGLLLSFNTFTTAPDGSSVITIYLDYGFIVRSWLIAVLAATVSGLLPARKSLRLNPAEVIREG